MQTPFLHILVGKSTLLFAFSCLLFSMLAFIAEYFVYLPQFLFMSLIRKFAPVV